MYLFLWVLISYIILSNGSSTEEALRIVQCLASCLNKTCREACNYTSISFNDFPEVSESTFANISLHCKGAYAMTIAHNPGTYIVERSRTKDAWSEPIMSSGSLSTFSNLTAGTHYRYRFRRVTGRGILMEEISDWFATYNAGYVPQEVKSISLDNIKTDDKNMCQLQAAISFEPAEDRSCNYHILYSQEQSLIEFYLSQTLNFSFELHCLDYEQNNTVSISSCNEDEIGTNQKIFMFVTPSCLRMRHDINICAPEKVEGLEVNDFYKEGFSYDILIRWKKPYYEPDNYTVQIDSFEDSSEDSHLRQVRVLTVSGNMTEILLSDIELGPYYEVSVVAESPGGTSTMASFLKNVDEFEELAMEELSYRQMIIIMPTLMTITVIGGAIFIYCRKQTSKHDNMQYKHFERLGREFVKHTVIRSLKKDYIVDTGDTLLDKKDKFELSPERLKIKEVLGSGAYGVVKLGKLSDGYGATIDVAVKMMKDNPSAEDVKNFHQEILMMKAAGQHPNIVSLIGYCTSYNDPLLVVEYCCKGDLQTYLRTIWQNMVNVALDRRTPFTVDSSDRRALDKHFENYGNETVHYENTRVFTNRLYDIQQDLLNFTENITATDLLNFARQVATGMVKRQLTEFLSSNRIVHRDLAARNVLVCADKVVKISDFGLSRDVYQENVYRKQGNGKLPLKWMAIEALTHQVYTTYSDVWSFGILLWEIVTLGGMPYPGTPTSRILNLLKSGYRMERPSNCGIELYNLMYSCWNVRPQSRPTFTELKEKLDKLLSNHSENKYLNLSEAIQRDELC